ncbi:hypothetical protein FRC08_001136 [Ceratobasidium sp. 394]|nr:hypothetical protein FRC08_001136 [Ceratobasidium sp. 394]
MSSPVYWRPKEFFYPLGNTPAVSLTRDLSAAQPADILLLGCGDPRHILYTCYADVVVPSADARKMNMTCCDKEPAVLARNILLFTLLEDATPIDTIWDIFYHFKINEQSLDVLVGQSELLCGYSRDIETWGRSPYGSFLAFLDSRSLSELRRYWKYYVDFRTLPTNRIDKLRLQHSKTFDSLRKDFTNNLSPSRSAGMQCMEAVDPLNNLFLEYWKNGTTSALASDIKHAVNLNPTFVYSSSGESFDPHSGTFPEGFHLAPAFAPVAYDPTNSGASGSKPSPMDVSRRQFRAWCDAFVMSRKADAMVIRFYAGDALSLCRALDLYTLSGSTNPDLLISEWHATRVHLDQLSTHAPPVVTKFDVIDTSNLANHVGLVNILLAARPLLKDRPISKSVLYTEEIKSDDEIAAYPFLDRLCASIPTVATLLGLAPLDYLSGFTTSSNVHEILHGVSRRLERRTWVDPTGGDWHTDPSRGAVAFEGEELVRLLFDIYSKILVNGQDVPTLMNQPKLSLFQMRQSCQHQPESVAIFFQLVKRRIHLKTGSWDTVVKNFLEVVDNNPLGRALEPERFQELCLQLHLHGIYTADSLKPDWRARFQGPLADVFKDWQNIPPVLCVVLTVPGKRVRSILGKDASPSSALTLQGTLRAGGTLGHASSSIRCTWSTCSADSGPGRMVLVEDPRGADGESNLVVSFWVPSHLLAYKTKTVGFGLISSPDAIGTFSRKLPETMEIFNTRLDDREHVKILSYRPVLVLEDQPTTQPNVIRFPDPASSNDHIQVLANVGEKQALLAGADPSVVQVSPCSMKLSVGHSEHIVSYPYPILGSGRKVRVARKSHYIEIIVRTSGPHDAGGYTLDYPPILHRDAYGPWNMHHIRLDRLPLVNIEDRKRLTWLDYHIVLQSSDRERRIMDGTAGAKSSSSKQLAAVKSTIESIANIFAVTWGERTTAFGLCKPSDPDSFYAVLLVGGIRLDLASFTIVIDTAVVPAVAPLIPKLKSLKAPYRLSPRNDEAPAWKRLLPTFVERARTWTHTANCEYASSGQIPISLDPGSNILCSCGAGIGFEADQWAIPDAVCRLYNSDGKSNSKRNVGRTAGGTDDTLERYTCLLGMW